MLPLGQPNYREEKSIWHCCAEDWKWKTLIAGNSSKHIHIHMVKCYIHLTLENECFLVSPPMVERIVYTFQGALICVSFK